MGWNGKRGCKRNNAPGWDDGVDKRANGHRLGVREIVAGGAVALVAVGSMIAMVPAVSSAIAPAKAQAESVSGSHGSARREADVGEATRQAKADGGERTTSVFDRAAKNPDAKIIPGNRKGDYGVPTDQALLIDHALGTVRTEFPEGKVVTLDSAAWKASDENVSLPWEGTMRVTAVSLKAFDSVEAAGIPTDQVNFDANDEIWQQQEMPEVAGERFVPVVLEMTYDNVDAVPAGGMAEFGTTSATIRLYNEASATLPFAQSSYFLAWSDTRHQVVEVDDETGDASARTPYSFSLDAGASHTFKIAYWVPEREVEKAQSGEGAFFVSIGDVCEETSSAGDGSIMSYPSKAVSFKMKLS